MTFNYQLHSFHLVTPSPCPFYMAVSAHVTAWGLIFYFQTGMYILFLTGFMTMQYMLYEWLYCVFIEATVQGNHTSLTRSCLSFGWALFIVSEAMLFFSFFWSFCWFASSPNMHMGCTWPPAGIEKVTWTGIPLLNTFILMYSGIMLTISHQYLVAHKFSFSNSYLKFTLYLAVSFSVLQGYEYYNCSFTMACSSYGSAFYMLTGLHGLHVLVGSIFLETQSRRLTFFHFHSNSHMGLECGIWYWHFVDMVWILLFFVVYVLLS